MGKHGTASIGLYVEFQAAVLRQLPRPDEFSPEVLEGWTKNQATLAKVMREALVPVDEKKDDVYPITINYDLSLAEMIVAGQYGWVNDDITADHFPIQGEGQVEVGVELVHFNRSMESDDVLKEMDKAGLRPATLAELLAFGAKYPKKQKEFPIIALGSVWQDLFGYRSVPALWSDGVRRDLALDCFEFRWSEYFRFAAVRKSA